MHVEGFKTCAKHGPSGHKTRLSAFTALPLPSQVTAHTLTCSGSPVPVPGHVAIIHVPPCHCFPRSPRTRCPAAAALCQRLATLPYRHTPLHPFRGFHNLRQARAIRTQNPPCGPLPLCHCLPRSPRTRCPAAATLCQRQAMSPYTPFRGFQNVREARPITTQNPSVGLYRSATAFPGHRTLVALQRQPFASAWPCRHTPCRGFQNVREAPHITTQNPSVGLYRFAAAFPGHRTHVDLQRQPCASAWPCRHNPCTALPLLPPVTANTLPCSGSPLPYRHTPLHPFRGFHNLREARAISGPLPLCHCLPRSPHTRCPAAAALCQRLAMSPYSI